MKRSLIASAVLLCTAFATPAGAQSLFVDGTVFAGIERRSHAEVTGELDSGASSPPDLNGTVAGGGFTIGTWLSPRVTVRLEVGLPGSVSVSDDLSEVIQLAPNQSITFSRTIEASEQLRSASTLLAYHSQRRHGVQLGYIGGAAFLVSRQHLRYTSLRPNFPVSTPVALLTSLPVETFETTLTSYTVTAEAGLDADIRISGTFSLVPQVRAIGFGNGISIRPGVAVRANW